MKVLRQLKQDIRCIRVNDPACRGIQFILYPCFHAMLFHRLICSPFYKIHLFFLARFFSQISRFLTGLEIHPGAKIEGGFFCDHGMGLVIGETCELGANCVLFHGVTLGGTGKHDGKRHPTLGEGVFIGTHATLLGPIYVGSRAKIGAEAVIINRDVPEGATVVGTPGKIVKINNKPVKAKNLPMSRYRLEERRLESKTRKSTKNNKRV